MKVWLKKYELKIVILIGFILVASVSYEAGFLKGKAKPETSIIIEKAPEMPKIELPAPQCAPRIENTNSFNTNDTGQNIEPVEKPQTCVYIGSKNSNKYHILTCRWAKQIKEENKVCFASIDDATAKNYLPDKNCIR